MGKFRALLVSALLFAACGGDNVGGDAGSTSDQSMSMDGCVPGAPRPCACTGGSSGTQLCDTDHNFGACQCDAGTVGVDAARPCTPGAAEACDCSPGRTGTRRCDTSGAGYSACVCCSGRSCGPDGAGGSCGTCASGLRCDEASGTCGALPPDPCSPAHPAGACPDQQTCVGGACCATRQACGAVCCSATSLCVTFGTGDRRCAPICTTNSDCGDTHCCSPLADATMPGHWRDYGACLTFGQDGIDQCRCTTGAECASGACTPMVDLAGNPLRPYVCSAPACQPYRRCTGLTGSCPNGYCNLCDSNGNCFCAAVCRDGAQCGNAQCATYARTNGSCPASQLACQPR